MNELVGQVASLLRGAQNVAVLTGAGISAESGLRTFRGGTSADIPADMQALWKEFDPVKFATPEAFNADPAAVSRWYDWRRLGCLAAIPNAGHIALAGIEQRLTSTLLNPQVSRRFTLFTQNVDRLHQKAGSVNVVELHGSIIQWRCTTCRTKILLGPDPLTSFPMPATCCSTAYLRPDVVWFGEMLPADALAKADEVLADCDLFLSIGTSSLVYPAAGLIQIASANGAATVEINAEDTPISRRVTHSIRGRSGEILPLVFAAM